MNVKKKTKFNIIVAHYHDKMSSVKLKEEILQLIFWPKSNIFRRAVVDWLAGLPGKF